jgi:hypothetical protein
MVEKVNGALRKSAATSPWESAKDLTDEATVRGDLKKRKKERCDTVAGETAEAADVCLTGAACACSFLAFPKNTFSPMAARRTTKTSRSLPFRGIRNGKNRLNPIRFCFPERTRRIIGDSVFNADPLSFLRRLMLP